MCAELAHEHALEDLHKITEHSPEQNDPARGRIRRPPSPTLQTGYSIRTRYIHDKYLTMKK